jgi:uncharacterized protein (TIGR02757 family)
MHDTDLLHLLEERSHYYNRPAFIEHDPVSVPHCYTVSQDIEIAGFLTATLSWGNRKSIIANARRLMALMGPSPYQFLLIAKPDELRPFLGFVHRTFNGDDCLFFIASLQYIYREFGSMEPLFRSMNPMGPAHAICHFRKTFLTIEHLVRSEKHIADPMAGSAAKRINMFLRWMVRNDNRGVDFGIWRSISPSSLVCPLDVHSGRVARSLGLLKRKQNDWKAAVELTERLRDFDPLDPVRFDFALFGMGVDPIPRPPSPRKGRGRS